MKNKVLPIVLGVCCVLLAVSVGYLFVLQSEYNAHMNVCPMTRNISNGEFLGVMPDANLPSVNSESITDFEMTEDMALEMADFIFGHIYGAEVVDKGTFSVYEIPADNVYVVSRQPEDVIGTTYNIALDKETGAIVKIWVQ